MFFSLLGAMLALQDPNPYFDVQIHQVGQVGYSNIVHCGLGAPFVFVFVRDGGKCERFTFRFEPKKN
jgi:hypothetical protein